MKKIILIFAVILAFLLNTDFSNAYTIRIGLQTRVTTVDIGSQYQAIIWDGSYKKPLVKISGMQKYLVYSKSNRIFLKNPENSNSFDTGYSSVLVVPMQLSSYVYNNKCWYHGQLMLIAKGNSVTAVNVLDIEDYLKGVVPSEMPAGWNVEALKAQAITARSYALANLNKRSSEGYDLVDTPLDQAYKGASHEDPRSNYAVETTKGQVIASGENIVPAYYHSSSGGVTDTEGWSGKISFVKSVRDFDFESPKASWEKSYNINNFSNALSSAGYSVGKIQQMLPIEKTEGYRVKKLKLIGSAGTKIISGDSFKNLFGLTSTLFNAYIDGALVKIAGRGNGHGLGMSQWGAKALADRGCTAYQIIGYYYNNVQIKKII